MTAILRSAATTILAALFVVSNASVQAPAQVSPQTSSQEGLQLLHKMQSALGGAEKIAAIHDYEETVRAQIWNNAGTPMGEVRKRTRWMRNPDLLRVDQIGPRDTYVLYFDGNSGTGWEMLPDTKGTDKLKTTGEASELAGGELKFAENYLSNFDLKVWLADRTPGYTVTSPAQNVVRIVHDGTASDITLDPTTWLPAKSASVSLANPDQPAATEMRMEGWTEVAGIHFSTHRANYHNGVKLAEMTEEEAIHVNAGLTRQDLAAMPSDFAPDIPSR